MVKTTNSSRKFLSHILITTCNSEVHITDVGLFICLHVCLSLRLSVCSVNNTSKLYDHFIILRSDLACYKKQISSRIGLLWFKKQLVKFWRVYLNTICIQFFFFQTWPTFAILYNTWLDTPLSMADICALGMLLLSNIMTLIYHA